MEPIKRQKNEEFIQSFLSASRDVIFIILTYLPISDIASVTQICTQMKDIINTENFWCFLLLRDYEVKRDSIFDANTSNKEIYKQEKEFEEKNERGELSWDRNKTWDLKNELDRILWWSCRKGRIESVKCCLRRGVDINKAAEYSDGWTALMRASLHGHEEVAELLLSKGAEIDKGDDDGRTALMFASWWVKKEIVELLLNKGADIDRVDNNGWTALIIARGHGHKHIVEFLLNWKKK